MARGDAPELLRGEHQRPELLLWLAASTDAPSCSSASASDAAPDCNERRAPTCGKLAASDVPRAALRLPRAMRLELRGVAAIIDAAPNCSSAPATDGADPPR